jgi:hypothetical protein
MQRRYKESKEKIFEPVKNEGTLRSIASQLEIKVFNTLKKEH